ncbi:MAG TPA: 3-oxoacyl-ACP reductase family protein [Planctomycetota bacterium]|nr:3-oxoacyl-ACP reductase family protein [Planctomycetota bacterium]
MTTTAPTPTTTKKVALVTGASRGIGAAIAKRLAQGGAAVAITYTAGREKAEEVVAAIRAAGGTAIAIQADSGNPAAVRSAVAQTVAAFGALDILVNNAGVAVMGPIDTFAMADYERLVAVNITGVFVATQETVRHIKNGGRIVMIGSVNTDRIPFANSSIYALTKGAVASFTRGLARDLGARAITVNNVQPGPVDTDMNPATGPFADTLKGLMALGRYGRGEEIAAMVAYLVSPAAAYVTGANLTIDGGFDA